MSENARKGREVKTYRPVGQRIDVHGPRYRVSLAVRAADLGGPHRVLHHTHALGHQPGEVTGAQWTCSKAKDEYELGGSVQQQALSNYNTGHQAGYLKRK